MNADLERSLKGARKTVAAVNTQNQASTCIEQATDYWIRTYRSEPWSVITIDLTLLTSKVTAVTQNSITNQNCGVYNSETYQGCRDRNLLVVYSTDKYTEPWVHESIIAFTEGLEHRILNVVRNDPGELIDLGGFKLG